MNKFATFQSQQKLKDSKSNINYKTIGIFLLVGGVLSLVIIYAIKHPEYIRIGEVMPAYQENVLFEFKG